MVATIGIVIAIIIYLIMEHPVAFWCLFAPLIIAFVLAVICYFKRWSGHFANLFVILVIVIAMIIALIVVCAPGKVEDQSTQTEVSDTHEAIASPAYTTLSEKIFQFSKVTRQATFW